MSINSFSIKLVFGLLLPAFTLMSFKVMRVTKKDAITIAERYVRVNGYTEAPADTTDPRLSYTTDEIKGGIEEMLKTRHNTLLPKAVKSTSTRKGWYITFEYTEEAQKAINKHQHTPHKLGALISISPTGSYVEMSCQNVILNDK